MKRIQRIKGSILRSSPKLQRRLQSMLWLGCCMLIMTVNGAMASQDTARHKGVTSVDFSQPHSVEGEQKAAKLAAKINPQPDSSNQVASDSIVPSAAQQVAEHKLNVNQGMIRTAVTDVRKQAAENHGVTAADIFSSGQSLYREFSLYDAYTRLFTDNNGDGYYQTLSITFDADVYSMYVGERAEVFADMYLSRNGGPWVLYHTTDIFTIIDDSSDDDYEVLSTLHTGYPSDSYDVLIDLYEVGNPNIVASISSEDTDNLYALPLQSSDYDVDYVEVVEVSGGALGVGVFSVLLLLAYRRRT